MIRYYEEDRVTSKLTSVIYGVTIILNKSSNHLVTGYKSRNGSIIVVRIGFEPIVVNFIQVYVPTSAALNEETEAFHNEL